MFIVHVCPHDEWASQGLGPDLDQGGPHLTDGTI